MPARDPPEAEPRVFRLPENRARTNPPRHSSFHRSRFESIKPKPAEPMGPGIARIAVHDSRDRWRTVQRDCRTIQMRVYGNETFTNQSSRLFRGYFQISPLKLLVLRTMLTHHFGSSELNIDLSYSSFQLELTALPNERLRCTRSELLGRRVLRGTRV